MSIQHRHNPELYADELAASEQASRRTGIGMPYGALKLMAEWDRVYEARIAAGWELDDNGWYARDPGTGDLIPLSQWEDLGLDAPEDK